MENSQPLTDLICKLQDKSPSAKRKAINGVCKLIQKQNNSDAAQLFDSQLSAPITALILDQSESIREAALRALLEMSGDFGSDFNIQYMKILLPSIWEQLGCYESMCVMIKFKTDNDNSDDFKAIHSDEISTHKQEASEEVRILMVELLSQIININHHKFTQFLRDNDKKYCLQYLNILHLLFNDKCPKIRTKISQLLLNQIDEYQDSTNKKQSDICNKDDKFFQYIFDDYAEYLCSSLAKGCMHQRGKIRLISFQLLSKIIENNIKIKHEILPWITDEQKIWKYISHLTFDKTQYIRKSIPVSAFKWLSLLIKTETKTNSMQCAKIWMLLLNENGLNLLQQQKEFDIQDELLKCVSFVITLCVQKVSHWQSMHRLFGIKALVTLTLCLESKLSSKYVVDLLPHFVSLIECQNDEILKEVNTCLKLYGQFIPIEDYSDFLFSKFNDISIKSYLKISAQIFTGYNDQNINEENLFKICEALSNSLFLQQNSDDIGSELLKATINLLSAYRKHNGNVNSDSLSEILLLLLQTHAGYLQNHQKELLTLSVQSSERLYNQISTVIALLTKHNEDDNENKSDNDCIWQENFKKLYERIDFKCNKENSYYLFGALVYYSKQFISQHMGLISPVFQQCNNEQNTETARFNILSILHLLLKDTIEANNWKNYTQAIFEILLPNIVWKVGKFRMKLRAISLNCMLILYKNNSVDPNITWICRAKLISILKSRLDDSEPDIRAVTVELFRYVLSNLRLMAKNNSEEIMNEKELASLCQSILDRYDDSKDEIRILTCSTLQSLIKCMDNNKQNTAELYKNIIETSLVHLDDSDDMLQQRIFSFLKDVSDFNASVFHAQLTSVNTDHLQSKSQKLIQLLQKI